MAEAVLNPPAHAPPKRRNLLTWLVGAESKFQQQDALLGYLFALPWILGLIIFIGGPMIYSLYLSFTEHSIVDTPTFVGLQNYRRAFFEDDLFYTSLGRTFYYAIIVVPVTLVGSLFLAILLNQNIKGRNWFRTIFFVPHLTPEVAMAVIWLWLLHPQLGPFNAALDFVGLPTFGWLSQRETVVPSLAFIAFWAGVGGNRMLIFLAGLQGVPSELYEAADLDGANGWRKFWHITLPMISPTMLFNLVLGIIGALKVFNIAWVATGGGPAYGSWFFALHVFENAFEYYRLGYGSALAWIFAVILIVFTLIQLWLSNRWVYYAGEDK